ncbi:GNAT family N-acetyltransferase [Bacillus carboniphilus]|uniref:GNAT family N-acetyltransferase n=1 Tax=Bacillus carboniphilus TaxID=86663 RepID=A0ABN0W5K5_9BACI
MRIREATIDDIEGIASVHIQAWKETYKGIISDGVLSSLNMEQKIKQWMHIVHEQEKNNGQTIVAVNSDEKIIGFAHFGKERTGKYSVGGELTAIYILKKYHRKGIGRALLNHGVRYLMDNGYNSLLVWVLSENPSKAFYEGFYPIELDREWIQIGEKKHEEIAYGWKDIKDLQRKI